MHQLSLQLGACPDWMLKSGSAVCSAAAVSDGCPYCAKVCAATTQGLLSSQYAIFGSLPSAEDLYCVSLQRYIVRIIFAAPVYSVASFLSLLFDEKHLWFETLRDV